MRRARPRERRRRVRASRRSRARRALSGAARRDDGVGEGRDRQRRRQPQGPPPRRRSCSTCAPPSRSACADRPAPRRWRSPRAATPRSPPRRWPRRAEWPIDVFVPDWADAGRARRRSSALGRVDHRVRAARRRPAGRPGRAAVPRGGRRRRGAVQRAGTGERAVPRRRPHDRLGDGRRRPSALDRVVVQVGGGAFAACIGWGLGRRRPRSTPCRPRGARRWRGRGERAAGLAPDACRRAAGPS